METIWIADYDMGRFDMRAYGKTREDALGALVRAVKYHVNQMGASPDHLAWVLETEPMEVTLGVGYCDGAPCGPHANLTVPA
jgi:hypothetical protein